MVTETIYVRLLNEGVDVWRPVQALRRAGGVFLIVSKNDDPELEDWEFPSGSLVRCVQERAVELVPARSPQLRLYC
ncbi:MAG: hypothetical protein QM696_09105 [Steroidobacteraceae bacterium]